MANTWFVDRDGQERGPFTGQQLKAMATKGEVLPSDLVRRDDAKDWRLASSVKGLFDPVEAPKKAPPPVPPRQAASRSDPDVPSGETTPIWKHPALIAVSLVFCFPVGLVLVWLQNNWSTNKKLAWSGVTLAVWVPLIVFSQLEAKKTRNEVATAHEKWDAGDKASAVTTYRKSLDRLTLLSDRDRQLVLGRLIDFECEAGNMDSAKQLIAEAAKKQVTPLLNNPQAKTLFADEQAQAAWEQANLKTGGKSTGVKISHERFTQIIMPELPPNRIHEKPEGELEKEIGNVVVPDITKIDFLNGPNGEPIEMDRFYNEGATRYMRSYGYYYRNKSGKKVYHGPWYSFNLPNKKTSESIYVHGALKASNDWDNDGKPLSLVLYKSDDDISEVVYQYFDNGSYRFHGQYVDVRYIRTDSGHKINRTPAGLHFYYWLNGKVKQEEAYDHGQRVGIAIYNINGGKELGRGVLSGN